MKIISKGINAAQSTPPLKSAHKSPQSGVITDEFNRKTTPSPFSTNRAPSIAGFSANIACPTEYTGQQWWSQDLIDRLPAAAPISTDFDLNGVEYRDLFDSLKSLTKDTNYTIANFNYDLG